MEKQNKNLEKNGGYQNEDVIWHTHSNKLMIKMLEYFYKDIPVVDLGCGHNWYCGVLERLGYLAIGVDKLRLKGVDIHDIDLTDKIIDTVYNDGNEPELLNLNLYDYIVRYNDNLTKS